MNPFNSNPPKKFYIIANWMQGVGLSGGDRIFIEMSRRWARFFNIVLFISKDGWAICQRQGLNCVTPVIWVSDFFNRFGYFINYLYRSVIGIFYALSQKLDEGFLYSSSDFWPDVLPAFILKQRHKNIRWIAGFYLFAPNPWAKDSPYRGKEWILGFFYWLTQKPAYWLVNRYAGAVFVTSEPDVKKFMTQKRDLRKIFVIKGGVDIEKVAALRKEVPLERKPYDACFIGRFHYQKGVLELVDIWKSVCQQLPGSKLAMIGNGPLEHKVHDKVRELGLENNIDLLGFMDGQEKFNVFQNSKIIVHPATYDSGGMAAAEVMAWGLPGVSFDLEALRTYYPKGMLKTPCFDIQKFADNILLLLTDQDLYQRVSQEALVMIRQEWGWDQRAEQILKQLYTGLNIS